MKEAAAKNEAYSALLVSGDIYDRAMPPSEAVSLLNSFLVKCTKELPDLHIFMNSGNHDSAARLAYASEFLALHNIHFSTDTKNITEPVILSDEEGQKVAFYQLPFLTPLSISKGNPDTSGSENLDSEIAVLRTQQELYDEACSQIITSHRKNYGEMPLVLNAHLFTSGSLTASSERTNVGTAEQVDVSLFKDFTYGAFGHIHKYQSCDKEKHCYYPGALLAYNFDDNPENGLLEVTIKSDEKNKPSLSVNRIFLQALHPITKITAKMNELIGSCSNKSLITENQQKYVQVILTDEVMPTEAFSTLKTVFPNLLSVISQEQNHSQKNSTIQQRKEAILSNDPEKIFIQFMKDANAGLEDDELFQKQKTLFIKEATELSEEEK
jgi:exonuclease SbcD